MIRTVLDANVLASGFAGFTSQRSTPGELLRRWRDEAFVLIYSVLLLDELERTLDKPYFRQRQTTAQQRQVVSLVREYGEMIELIEVVRGIAPDPDDDHVLSTALNGEAAYIVTGDKPLLSVGSYNEIYIVSPVEFLAILDAER